ncbi:MAG: PTS system mannose/fructose/N-acetylgalactosamine-transporter subunit IIB [bacterium]
MSIEFVRIDDKLIHAQIILGWTSIIKPTQIIVANDEAAQNELRKEILLAAASELSLDSASIIILTLKDTISYLKRYDTDDKKFILVLSNPSDVVYLINNNISIKKVSLGWMSFSLGKNKMFDTVYVNGKDIQAFQKLSSMGVEIKYQFSPYDPELDITL